MRIALLFHERDRSRDLSRYDIMHIAKYWRVAGHEVISVFGVEQFFPADIALLHVDLSVVPQHYLDFAKRYRYCLNTRAIDIRKSRISSNLLKQHDHYRGPVIIKSDRNAAGSPERMNGSWCSRSWLKVCQTSQKLRCQPAIRRADDYLIVDNLSLVPEKVWTRHDLVVEKFLPERIGNFYCTRTYLFLADGETCQLNTARGPIVSWKNTLRTESCDVHPEIVQWRQKLGFDYGKFDYVIHDGRAVLLDANKTTGSGDSTGDALVERDRRTQAEGLLRYCNSVLPNCTGPSINPIIKDDPQLLEMA